MQSDEELPPEVRKAIESGRQTLADAPKGPELSDDTAETQALRLAVRRAIPVAFHPYTSFLAPRMEPYRYDAVSACVNLPGCQTITVRFRPRPDGELTFTGTAIVSTPWEPVGGFVVEVEGERHHLPTFEQAAAIARAAWLKSNSPAEQAEALTRAEWLRDVLNA